MRCARRLPLRSLALTLAIALCGCATLEPPKPWERGNLAKRDMQFGADPLGAKLDDHIYASKEAVSGGLGVGGGGCGCN